MFIILLIVLLIGSAFASYVSVNNSLIYNLTFDYEKYPRLPNNLEPYVCDNGEVDLDLAVYHVKKGMNPKLNYDVPKENLRCNN